MILLYSPSNLCAQGHIPCKREVKNEVKISELRKVYLTDKLKLSEAEQQAFWPIYNEYKLQDKALRDSFQKKYHKNEVIFMDDKRAEEYLIALLKLKDYQQVLFKECINKLRKILPIKKVALLPVFEQEFKLEILKKSIEMNRKDNTQK